MRIKNIITILILASMAGFVNANATQINVGGTISKGGFSQVTLKCPRGSVTTQLTNSNGGVWNTADAKKLFKAGNNRCALYGKLKGKQRKLLKTKINYNPQSNTAKLKSVNYIYGKCSMKDSGCQYAPNGYIVFYTAFTLSNKNCVCPVQS